MSALNHVRVVEIAEAVAGEYCGKLLADFGAEVIKIERPGSGSPTRAMGPFLDDEPGAERSGLFAYLNTNKRSVALDLGDAAGRETLGALLAKADVLIDDHAPGWLAEMGLDAQALAEKFPQLIACSITPFGQSAPPERRHATDLTVMQASGWGYHTPSGADPDKPPLKGAGRFLPSYEGGLDGAMCVAAALFGREERGTFIDISMQETLASRVDYVLAQMVAGEMDVGEERTRFDLGGPAGIFPCRDGFVYIFASAPTHWEAIKTLTGNPEWAQAYPDNWLERGLSPERIAQVRGAIVEWLKGEGKDEAAEKAQALGLTLVPLNNADDLERSPQLAHRGYFEEVAHSVLGTRRYPGVPYRMSATPAVLDRAAPMLGEHDALLDEGANA
ncbi:CaiB/BaiF CoA transferase family protein [Stakelama tenebrarum]|uniref:CoA transferase n=1 Tax=Stakelama tenebrarum TaxID=2711215 RepID=A0A6G6Y762_9SPHN|nr:CoA transferase [Sphingosinithalassobacter tenebrarum]QIG80784.1 CoA transferase [Sphingosinithalassobacter tenebrarum]